MPPKYSGAQLQSAPATAEAQTRPVDACGAQAPPSSALSEVLAAAVGVFGRTALQQQQQPVARVGKENSDPAGLQGFPDAAAPRLSLNGEKAAPDVSAARAASSADASGRDVGAARSFVASKAAARLSRSAGVGALQLATFTALAGSPELADMLPAQASSRSLSLSPPQRRLSSRLSRAMSLRLSRLRLITRCL